MGFTNKDQVGVYGAAFTGPLALTVLVVMANLGNLAWFELSPADPQPASALVPRTGEKVIDQALARELILALTFGEGQVSLADRQPPCGRSTLAED